MVAAEESLFPVAYSPSAPRVNTRSLCDRLKKYNPTIWIYHLVLNKCIKRSIDVVECRLAYWRYFMPGYVDVHDILVRGGILRRRRY